MEAEKYLEMNRHERPQEQRYCCSWSSSQRKCFQSQINSFLKYGENVYLNKKTENSKTEIIKQKLLT